MRKWELVSSLSLALLGLGVMVGQGFEFNVWVFLLWGTAALLPFVAWLHKEPKGRATDIKLGPSDDATRIHRAAVADGRWGTWIAGKFVLDEPVQLASMSIGAGHSIDCGVFDWVPSGALLSLRYDTDYRPTVVAIRRRGSRAEPQRLSGTGLVDVLLDESSKFEVAAGTDEALRRAGAGETALVALWLLGWTPSA